MQRSSRAADGEGMRTLALWLMTSASVSTGYVIAAQVGGGAWRFAVLREGSGQLFFEVVADLVVALMVLGAVAVVFAFVRPHRRTWLLPAAVLSFSMARGCSAGASIGGSEGAERSMAVRASRRGLATRIRHLEVLAASVPGPRCRLEVRTDAGQELGVMVPIEVCPLGSGDRIAVLGQELGAAPKAPHGPIMLQHVWPAPSSDRVGVSHAAATIRMKGWQVSRGRPDLGFVVAATLGLPDALPPLERAGLRRSGLGHLIAVSGLHVGLAAFLLLAILRWTFARLPRGPHLAYLLSSVPILFYVVLTGAAPPAVRAALMFGVVGLGALTGRPTHGFTVLAAGCAAMLLAVPQWALAPGFQLSVAAMIVLLGLPRGSGAAVTSWQLSWALLPLVWLHFDASSDGSVLANAIGVPVFTFVVVPAAVCGWALVPWLGAIALEPAAAGGRVILDVSQAVADLPDLPRPVWIALAILTWVPTVREGLRPSLREWLPHRGAATLFLVIAAVRAWAPTPPVPGWTAWGGSRVAEVLVVDERGQACLRDPVASPSQWERRLDERAAHSIVRLDFFRGFASAPHRAALSPKDGLEHRGLPRCEMPGRAQVDAALTRCAAFADPPIARRMNVNTNANTKPDVDPNFDADVANADATDTDVTNTLECWSAQSQQWRRVTVSSLHS